MASARPELLRLTPRQQLAAGRLPRRLVQLFVGLWLYGTAAGMLIRAAIGLDPWNVFHQGLTFRLHLSFGTVTILVGALVLLLWIPLRQWPGLGTVCNVVVIGIAADATLAMLSQPDSLWARALLFLTGVVAKALASALYIGSQLGPGPRDGLMTGFSHRSGLSIRVVRTLLEVTVMAIGWLLGGALGVGTVIFALAIGPLVQFFLPLVIVPLHDPRMPVQPAEPREHPTAPTPRRG